MKCQSANNCVSPGSLRLLLFRVFRQVSLYSIETGEWFSYYLNVWCKRCTAAAHSEAIVILNALEVGQVPADSISNAQTLDGVLLYQRLSEFWSLNFL